MIQQEIQAKIDEITNSQLPATEKLKQLQELVDTQKKAQEKAQQDQAKAEAQAKSDASTKKIEITEMKGVELVTLKGEKGDTGDAGPAGESITGPQGPIGPKGADSKVRGPKGPKGDQGEPGEDGKDGADADPSQIVTQVMEQIKLPKTKEVILDTPSELKDKLETLKGEDRLDAKAIKNLPKGNGTGGPGGVGHVIGGRNIAVSGAVVSLDITVSATPPDNPVVDQLWIQI